MDATTNLFFYVVTLIATGIFLSFMLNKLERIYDKATSNITAEPQNIADILQKINDMQMEHLEIAEVMELMYKKLEELDATQGDLHARFIKQFPGSAPKQTQQVLNIAAGKR